MLPFAIESAALSWVLTYALHSSVLLCAAWLLTRKRRAGSEGLQELVWKTALVGGLVSASVQVGLDLRPLAGRFDIEAREGAAVTARAEPPAAARASEAVVSVAREAPAPLAAVRTLAPQRALAPSAPRERPLSPEGALSPSPPPPPAASRALQREPERAAQPALAAAIADWSALILAAWILGGALGVSLLALALSRLADHLAGRRTLSEGALHELFVALCERAGLARVPRLCVCARLDSPATVGVLAPVVCVPTRAQHELAREHQEAMLAHELAHVARRDPQWAFLARLLERALFFQPLNGLARRRLAVLSEYLADAWAVEQTGRGLPLARCLTEVAGWVLERRLRVGLLPMAVPGSLLGDRVRRLLDLEAPARRARPSRAARALRVLPAIAFVGGLAFVLPGAAARAGETRERVLELEHAARSSAHTPVIEALLDELDGEFDELLADIDALDRALEEGELTDSFAQPVAVLRERLARLRESKTRLDALAPLVMQLLMEELRTPAKDAASELTTNTTTDSSRPRSEP